jgi:hypothetical protein
MNILSVLVLNTRFKMLVFGFSIMFFLFEHRSNCNSQDIKTIPLPDGFSIEVDANNPCGNIIKKENMQFLGENVIAYFSYEKENVVAIRVRLTCKYREKHMPDEYQPSMSYSKFEQILTTLSKIRSFGMKVSDDPIIYGGGGVNRRSRKYEKARIEWAEYTCMKKDINYGCGIRRIDVFYTEK